MNSNFIFYSAENNNNTINNKEEEIMMNSNTIHSAIVDNPVYELAAVIPHCPVMLVLDTSHSMWGKGLLDMKNSLIAFYNTLDEVSFSSSLIDIAAVSMGDRLGMIEEFTPFENSLLPQANIRPKGYTPMAAALELALEKLQTQIGYYEQNHINYATPQLIILSDGDSSDDITDIAAELRNMVAAGKLFVRTIAMGENPLLANLRSLGGELVEPVGELPEAFEDVGQRVSMVYEAEAVETILDNNADSSMNSFGDVFYIIDGSNCLHIDKYRSGITLKYVLSITDYLQKKHIPFQVFLMPQLHICCGNTIQLKWLYTRNCCGKMPIASRKYQPALKLMRLS